MFNKIKTAESFQAVDWCGTHLRLLDQRQLPHKVCYQDYDKAVEVATAIKKMVVRGAPAIGIAAAYAVVLAARAAWRQAGPAWKKHIKADLSLLLAARPTAINLQWALEQMQRCIARLAGAPEADLLRLALKIHQEDINANQVIGKLGATVIDRPCTVFTHCNAGALATGGYGTALGVIRSLDKQKKLRQVYITETRPWLQGARLTAWELQQAQIPATLIIDAAAASLMRDSNNSWLIVGADRITAHGDVINKVGTYMHAVLARQHNHKVMVAAPSSTIDMSITNTELVPIEHRDASEIASYIPNMDKITVVNPVFDITPAGLVNLLITERGMVACPDLKKMQRLVNAK